MPPLPRNARNIPKIQTDAQCTSSLSLTLLNKPAAGIRSLDLVRSDMQQIRADAPNPDSRFKEHALVRTRRHKPHTTKLAWTSSPNALAVISVPTATMVNLWWRWTVSNRRPPACKAGALPLSYTPQEIINESFLLLFFKKEALFFLVRKNQRTFIPTLVRTSNQMVGQGGFEPPTPRLSSVCSNQLSYWPNTRTN